MPVMERLHEQSVRGLVGTIFEVTGLHLVQSVPHVQRDTGGLLHETCCLPGTQSQRRYECQRRRRSQADAQRLGLRQPFRRELCSG